MRHVLNVFRFIIYLPLCLALLALLYTGIAYYTVWISSLGWIWIILGGTMLFGAGILISVFVFGFLGGILSLINPYKKAGGWVIGVLATGIGIFQIVNIWSTLDINYTRQMVACLISSALIFYSTIIFINSVALGNARQTFRELTA